jgi:hypothetical protein
MGHDVSVHTITDEWYGCMVQVGAIMVGSMGVDSLSGDESVRAIAGE